MDGADIRVAVIEELQSHAPADASFPRDLAEETRLESLGIDSMTAVSVISSLEARLKPTYLAGSA